MINTIEKEIKIIKSVYNKKMKHNSYLCFKNNYLILWDKELYFKTDCFLDMEFIVEAESFLSLYDNTKNIDFEIKKEENKLILKSKKINIDLPILNDVFIPNIEIKNFIKLPSNFLQALNDCSLSVSNNITDGILSCFLINKDNIISCNNILASKIELNDNLNNRFLLSSSFYKRIKNLKLNSYMINENFLIFSGDNFYVGTEMINDEYPDIGEYFIKEGIEIFITPGFREMINRTGSLITTKEEDEKACILIEKKAEDLVCSSMQTKGNITETDMASNLFPSKFNSSNILSFKINPYQFNKASENFENGFLKENCIVLYKDNFTRVLSLIGV